MTRRRTDVYGRALRLVLAALFVAATAAAADVPHYSFPRPVGSPELRHYVCMRAASSPEIDGELSDPCWEAAHWTADFVDIEGDLRPTPRFRTRAKMLWDDECFYVAAEMEEPDVWATLTRRDAVIFHDNDFEVFIDPDGDTHEYYELEVNAFGTEWDLLLTKPYRDNGTAVDSWDIQELRTGIAVHGTLNVPGDTDEGWSVELAIPWAVLEECAHKPTPPDDGDLWRVNFSRVEWRTEVRDGRYVKLTEAETGTPVFEDNWVWSPQGLINMHYPEMWGFVQFSDVEVGAGDVPPVHDPDHHTRLALFEVYYAEREYYGNNGVYTADLGELELGVPNRPVLNWPPTVHATPAMFEAALPAADGCTLHISHDGHVRHEPRPRTGQ